MSPEAAPEDRIPRGDLPGTVSFAAAARRTRFLWWAAGADPTILESIDCPVSERRFFAAIGAAVCLAVALAGAAAWLASGMVFPSPRDGGPSPLGFLRGVGHAVFTLVTMLVLFNLQRFLVGVAGRRSDWDGSGVRDALRMALVMLVAAGLSFAIATPLQVMASEPSVRMRSLAIEQVERMARVPAVDAARLARFADLFADQARLTESAGARRAAPAPGDPLLPGASAAQRLPAAPPACDDSLAACLEALGPPANETPTDGATAASAEARLAALRQAIDAQSRDLLRAKLQLPDPEERPEGLIRRAALAYEGNALLCAIVFGVVLLVMSLPLVFRLLADRSPYDLLVRYRNHLLLAAHGIEPEAYEIFDERGERHVIDEFSEPRHEYQKRSEEILAQRRAWAAERQDAYATRVQAILERR